MLNREKYVIIDGKCICEGRSHSINFVPNKLRFVIFNFTIMRTIYNHLIFLWMLVWSLLVSISTHAQTYEQTLETVWITNTTTQKTLETVSVTNQHIRSNDAFKLNKAIRKAKRLLTDSNAIKNRQQSDLTVYRYLKTLKQAANRAVNEAEFRSLIMDELPALEPVFTDFDQVEDLYTAIRKDTFNGRLEALPSVL